MTLAELKAMLAKLFGDADTIQNTAKAESRELTDEEATGFDALLEKADGIQTDIDKAEAVQTRQDRMAAIKANLDRPGVRKTSPESPAPIQDDSDDNTKTPGLRVLGHASRHDKELNGFPNAGQFLAAVYSASNPSLGFSIDERLQPMSAATPSGMNQATGSEGGFAVLPQFSNQIWDGMNRTPDNLLNMTEIITLSTGESITIPANAEVSRKDGFRYGGVSSAWLEEAGQIASSTPTLRQVKLEPHQLAVLVFVTEKLLNNADTALDQYVTRAATDEINFTVSEAIVNGDGVGKPQGFLTSGALVTVAKEDAQTAKTVVAANINKMYSRLHSRRRAGAVWFINQDVEPQLMGLNTDTTNGVPVFLPAGMMVSQPLMTLLGLPIIPIEYAATVGSKGDIILADMKGYTSAIRGTIDTAMSMHLRFDFAEMAFRFIFSVDGQTWLQQAIEPFNSTLKLSSFVTLAVRS